MNRSVLKALIVSLVVSVVAVLVSVLFGTRNIPEVAGTGSEIVAGVEMLGLFAQNPRFGLGVLLPVFMPMFLACLVSTLIVSAGKK